MEQWKECNICTNYIDVTETQCNDCKDSLILKHDMANCKTFDELLLLHIDWLEGKRIGFNYNTFNKLEDICGSTDFVSMCGYISRKFKMIIMESSPPIDITISDIFDFESHCYDVELMDGTMEKVRAKLPFPRDMHRSQLVYKSKPYIAGFIKMENLLKLFKCEQKELSIIAIEPIEYDKLNEVDGVNKMKISNAYIKNDFNDNYLLELIELSRYYYDNGQKYKTVDIYSGDTKTKLIENSSHVIIFCDKFGMDEREFIQLLRSM